MMPHLPYRHYAHSFRGDVTSRLLGAWFLQGESRIPASVQLQIFHLFRVYAIASNRHMLPALLP